MLKKQTKKRIDVTEESMKELMQETYNEIVDERNKALIAYKKFGKDINENSDIALIGKITNDLLKIIDGTIEKKLKLIKIQSDILYKNGKNVGGENESSIMITDEDKEWAKQLIKNNKDFNEKEYE